MENSDILSVPPLNVGGSIQNVCNLALTRFCLSGCCHCKNVEKTLQDSMQVVSGNAQLCMLSHDSCQCQLSEMEACESGVVESHFHSDVELQVELYSCGCCDREEPCMVMRNSKWMIIFMNNQPYF